MEPETSQFESSEMLATYLASTPLLEESWRMCDHANKMAQQSFAVKRVGDVSYMAFSGVQVVDCAEESCRNLVKMGDSAKDIFGGFSSCVDGNEEPVMVHGGLLQLFLFFYQTQEFQNKMHEIMNESKTVILSGHSLGGALASLSALWLLSYIQTSSLTIEVLCITYGSPLLGNQSFAQTILHQRWSGNFCHIVAQHDIVPRLLFAPATSFFDLLALLFSFWQSSMASPPSAHLTPHLPYHQTALLFNKVLTCIQQKLINQENSSFWPFGSYMFCTEKGAICLDNGLAIVKLMYMTLKNGPVTSCVEHHLKYQEYINRVCLEYLQRKSLTDTSHHESSNEAGTALALLASGISSQEPVYGIAKDCLVMARQLGFRRTLNNAKMAVSLSKINPLRAQIEWYKAFCDDSDHQMGYYDSFKRRTTSVSGNKVNVNRIRLGKFWDELIKMLETNQLTHDFHKLAKYVNSAHFYMLLVEPLEIAEYYKTGMHKKKGHYIDHGREKRFKIFGKWWKDRKVGNEEGNPRSRFASVTQDPCFWARVEEARDSIHHITGEMDSRRHSVLLDKIGEFELYASKMIERKEVSKDVLAKNSSYNLFIEEWKELKAKLQLLPDAMVQDMVLEAESPFLLAFHDHKLVL